MRYSAKKNCGDGNFPNRYWVSEHNGYYIREKTEDGVYLKSIEEHDKTFQCKGKTYSKAFKTYQEALTFLDTLCDDNRIIEDRLSGQIFESYKVVCPCCGKEEWEIMNDISYTKKKMEEAGYKFE